MYRGGVSDWVLMIPREATDSWALSREESLDSAKIQKRLTDIYNRGMMLSAMDIIICEISLIE